MTPNEQFEKAYNEALPKYAAEDFSLEIRTEFKERDLREFAVKIYNAGRQDGWKAYYDTLMNNMKEKMEGIKK